MHHFISCIVVVDAGYSPPQQLLSLFLVPSLGLKAKQIKISWTTKGLGRRHFQMTRVAR